VLGEFVVARGGPGVERVAFVVVAGPDEPGVGLAESRVVWDEPGAGLVWSQVEPVAPGVERGEFAAGLDGSLAAWGEWVGPQGDCQGEPRDGWLRRIGWRVGLDDFQVGPDGWAE